MPTPAGVGVLAVLELPDPCLLGSDDDVVMYGLAARVLTDSDAPAEWGEPNPVACVNLRRAIGQRLDRTGLDDWERRCNEALGQDRRASSAAATMTLIGKTIGVVIRAIGARGPFAFTFSIDEVGIASAITRLS